MTPKSKIKRENNYGKTVTGSRHSFSAMRSFALRARGLTASSSSDAVIGLRLTRRRSGFLPQTQTGKSGGQVQPDERSAKVCFTMRSSKEWKVMIAILPPTARRAAAERIAGSIASNSAFTSMRMAWKERFAG